MYKIIATLFLLLSTIMVRATAEELQPKTLIHEDIKRSYQLYVPPSYKEIDAKALILALHGRGSNGLKIANYTELNSRADVHGFIMAYPDAINGTWFYPRGIGGFGEKPNDSEFLLTLVDQLKQEYGINPGRVFVTGISNGGFMAQRMVCDAPEVFSAAASVAATAFAGIETVCKSDVAVSMLFLHGTQDTLVPWDGHNFTQPDGSQELVSDSVVNTLKFWSNYNGCKGQVTNEIIPPSEPSNETQVTVYSSSQCDQNSAVKLYQIAGGGHNWPGVKSNIPQRITGKVNMDVHASDEIVKFFILHSRN